MPPRIGGGVVVGVEQEVLAFPVSGENEETRSSAATTDERGPISQGRRGRSGRLDSNQQALIDGRQGGGAGKATLERVVAPATVLRW